ncbi:unnamed protein product [Eruca vesicaria subsp. sativa]|uniref:Uncharacterized protein n=1 Tax=Eruca vesicaria subsp. sativa TaxID=29727 RepID=A0ABC8L367_ERUVS|nr:unnamed protein product [Eruca vesicaria subsp. sativa]
MSSLPSHQWRFSDPASPTRYYFRSGLASSSIEVGLEKVSLTVDDEAKGETSSAEAESESSSSSSSSSASSSSDEEEEESEEEESNKEKNFEDQMVMGKENDVAEELEEGEI